MFTSSKTPLRTRGASILCSSFTRLLCWVPWNPTWIWGSVGQFLQGYQRDGVGAALAGGGIRWWCHANNEKSSSWRTCGVFPSFLSMLVFSFQSTRFTLLKFIPTYFTLFDASVNSIFFSKFHFWIVHCKLSRNTIGFYTDSVSLQTCWIYFLW